MKSSHFFAVASIAIFGICSTGCNSTTTPVETPPPAAVTAEAITNPVFSIAPIEYAELNEKALQLFAKFDYDGWAMMLADNVVYSFPDGDVDTRTTLTGKEAVLNWWKNWKATSGVESMTLSEFNHAPLNAKSQLKGGAVPGIYVISYFSNKMVFSGKPVALRMNFSVHFNDDKKIDRYTAYYDRAVIINATGKNVLEKAPEKK